MLGLLDFANKWVEKGGLLVLAAILSFQFGTALAAELIALVGPVATVAMPRRRADMSEVMAEAAEEMANGLPAGAASGEAIDPPWRHPRAEALSA